VYVIILGSEGKRKENEKRKINVYRYIMHDAEHKIVGVYYAYYIAAMCTYP